MTTNAELPAGHVNDNDTRVTRPTSRRPWKRTAAAAFQVACKSAGIAVP